MFLTRLVNTTEAGQGHLSASVRGETTKPIADVGPTFRPIAELDSGSRCVAFKAVESGLHHVTIRFNDEPVPG